MGRLCKAENQNAESQKAEVKRQKIKWQKNQKAGKTKGRKSVGRKSKGRNLRNDRLDIGRQFVSLSTDSACQSNAHVGQTIHAESRPKNWRAVTTRS